MRHGRHRDESARPDGGLRRPAASEVRARDGRQRQLRPRRRRRHQEGRPEDKVADQDPIESVKCQADVHALRQKVKKLKGDCHEVEGRREQRESPVHRLKDVIEEQRYSDQGRDIDNARC